MLTETIRKIAASALDEKRVDIILGFGQGTRPFTTKPEIVDTPLAADRLVWNKFCVANLVRHIPKGKQKIGIIANGCTSRSIIVHIAERQIRREDLFIIGVPCQGMVDRRKLKKLIPGNVKLKEFLSDEGIIVLSGPGFNKECPAEDVLRETCIYCRHRNPVIYDFLVSEPVVERKDVLDEPVISLEKKSVQERSEYFRALYSSCTLCLACRNVCPLCYCPSCFADETCSGKKTSCRIDPHLFHLSRAMHVAGRCTECGSCDSACPKGINASILPRKLNKDIRVLYHTEIGLDEKTHLPLSVFNPKDPDI